MVQKKRITIVIGILILLLCSVVYANSFPYHAFNENVFNFEKVGEVIIEKKVPTEVLEITEKVLVHENPVIPTKPKGVVDEIKSSKVHQVEFTMDGINPKNLTIHVGDKVMWTNTRNYTKAMVQGSRQHLKIKSTILGPDESFTYTFTIPDNYTFVDAVMKAYVFRLTVLE